MGLASQSDTLQCFAYQYRCTRHDLLIKYVDVHAVDYSAADYSPKTAQILSNVLFKSNVLSYIKAARLHHL